MNIVQIINAKWWNAEAAYAYSLSKELIRQGHSVTIIGIPGKPVAEKAKKDGIPLIETWALNRVRPMEIMAFFFSMREFFTSSKVDIVNCQRSDGYPIIALAARLSRQRPALVRTRGDQRQVRRDPINYMLYTRFSDALIASGEIVKNGLVERLALHEEEVDVVYAAVDTEKFSPIKPNGDIRGEFGIDKDAPVVSILGRVSEVKGHRYLIEAAANLKKELPGIRFIAIVKEDDPNLPNLEKQVNEAGLSDTFFFTGFREDLAELMAACDIGIVTSIGSETNCRVALEWMAMGKPVIGTRIGVIPEVITDGEVGIIISPADPHSIECAVKKLVEDTDLRDKMGKKARELVEREYNEKLFAEKTIEIYKKALQKKPK